MTMKKKQKIKTLKKRIAFFRYQLKKTIEHYNNLPNGNLAIEIILLRTEKEHYKKIKDLLKKVEESGQKVLFK